MEVISINHKTEAKQKESMIEVLNYIKSLVESGDITEFVACSLDMDGIAQIHVSTMDLPGAVGLFEIGKHLLIQQESTID